MTASDDDTPVTAHRVIDGPPAFAWTDEPARGTDSREPVLSQLARLTPRYSSSTTGACHSGGARLHPSGDQAQSASPCGSTRCCAGRPAKEESWHVAAGRLAASAPCEEALRDASCACSRRTMTPAPFGRLSPAFLASSLSSRQLAPAWGGARLGENDGRDPWSRAVATPSRALGNRRRPCLPTPRVITRADQLSYSVPLSR